MSRADADKTEIAEVQRMLKASRLADVILRDRDVLTNEQRVHLANLIAGTS